MLVSFLYPFKIKNKDAPFLWVYYNQLKNFTHNQVSFILNESYQKDFDYFREQNIHRWELSSFYLNQDLYKRQNDYISIILNQIELDQIVAKYPDDITLFKAYLTDIIPELVEIIYNALLKIKDRINLIGLLSWSNCLSLKEACNRLDIPIIYNEIGPLRLPTFLPTGYFDFSGVNGCTESQSRFLKFIAEEYIEDDLLPQRDLLKVILTPEKANYSKIMNNFDEVIYDIGLALQVESDSNVIAFSNGFNNLKLIDKFKASYPDKRIIARRHPHGEKDYASLLELDDSIDSISFIEKCNVVATVNSGTAMEALLFGREIILFGDSPFSIYKLKDQMNLKDFNKYLLNFLVFGYQIPLDLMFNYQYINFRLNTPTEKEIFNYHLKYFQIKHEQVLLQNQLISKYDIKSYDFNNSNHIELNNLLMEKENRLDRLYHENEQLKMDNECLKSILSETFSSNSWRLTKPLRFLKKYFKL